MSMQRVFFGTQSPQKTTCFICRLKVRVFSLTNQMLNHFFPLIIIDFSYELIDNLLCNLSVNLNVNVFGV